MAIVMASAYNVFKFSSRAFTAFGEIPMTRGRRHDCRRVRKLALEPAPTIGAARALAVRALSTRFFSAAVAGLTNIWATGQVFLSHHE